MNYNGEEVIFWYKDHDDGHKVVVTIGVLEFIGRITFALCNIHCFLVTVFSLILSFHPSLLLPPFA